MVTKQKIQLGKSCKMRVTFAMPAIHGCDCLYLVGNFDEWPESVYRMQSGEDGTWFLVLELEAGREYQYHYRTDKGAWHTDLVNVPSSDGVNRLII
ncbi:MAG: hypothetical protein ACM33V_09880 [Chloroflexota bacterium]|nr:hypothetical protein [Anaerolineales bacterium]